MFIAPHAQPLLHPFEEEGAELIAALILQDAFRSFFFERNWKQMSRPLL